jgi:hypothetical protein
VSKSFCYRFSLPLLEKPVPAPLFVIDGRPIASCSVHSIRLRVKILDNSFSTIEFDGTSVAQFPFVLGIPWLREANPAIDWKKSILISRSKASGSPLDLEQGLLRALPIMPILSAQPPTQATQAPNPRQTIRAHATSASMEPLSLLDTDVPDKPEYISQLRDLVPSDYHGLLSAFSKQRADTLPPHRP